MKINGIDFKIEDQTLEQALDKALGDSEKEKDILTAKISALDKENDELKKEIDTVKAERDAAKAEKLSDEAIREIAGKIADVQTKSKAILKDSFDEKASLCDMRKSVIKHVFDLDMADKSPDYIQAMFDSAVIAHSKAAESVKKVNDSRTKNNAHITRDSARNAYLKRMGLEG
jgi:hypothetical protein